MRLKGYVLNLSDIGKEGSKTKVRTTGVSPFSELEITKVYPNPDQPRKSFTNIEELASSIKADGLLQPIVVVQRKDGYMIVGGERRYRASIQSELKTIKAHIIQADDKKIQELALVENIQRDDLTDFEKAKFIGQLWSSDNYASKGELAEAIGKKQPYLSKVFAALKLDDSIIEDIENNKSTIGIEVLQELSSIKDKEAQKELYTSGAKRDEIRAFKDKQKEKVSEISPAKKRTKFTCLGYKGSDSEALRFMLNDGKQTEIEGHLKLDNLPNYKTYTIIIEEI